MKAGVEEYAGQAMRLVRAVERAERSLMTRRLLVRAGAATAGATGYLVPSMRRLALADGVLCVSPQVVDLTVTVSPSLTQPCLLNGCVRFTNNSSSPVKIERLVAETSVTVGSNTFAWGSQCGDCASLLTNAPKVNVGQCASAGFTITLAQINGQKVTVSVRITLGYRKDSDSGQTCELSQVQSVEVQSCS